MTISDNGAEGIRIRTIPLPGFEASWAGVCPWPPGYYCFGSDDGRVRIIGRDGATELCTYALAPSEDAVNGVAFAGDHMAVSTRSDVSFLNVPFLGQGHGERAVFNGGAHGVAVTRGGGIVAPMGRRGVLLMSPIQGQARGVNILEPADESFYVYKVVALAAPDRTEFLACAGRRGGFTAMPLAGDAPKAYGRCLRPHGVDFVDVAALAVDGFPLAVAALGLDCSIYLVRDLGDMTSKKLQFNSNCERAYRLLCAEGHVFLLTDKSLYTFANLAERFLRGEEVNDTPISRWKIDAVDASLGFDHTLLITMPDRVDQIEIDAFLARVGSRAGQSQSDSQIMVTEETPLASAGDEPWEPGDTPPWERSEEFELTQVA